MGGKKLKAIAVRGHGSIRVAHPEKFIEAAERARKKILNNPIAKPFRERTLAGMMYTDAERDDPWWDLMHTAKNSQEVYWSRERRRRICSPKVGVYKYRKKIFACFSCPVGCMPFSEIDEGKYKGTKGSGFWVNSVYWPARMDVDDPAAALKYHINANRLGLDGDDSSVVLSWAFECYDRKLLTKEDTDGLELEWGNEEAMIKMQEKLAYREGIGDLLADGVVEASRKLGKGSDKFAIQQKGQDTADPYRVAKSWALGCCTSPVAGRHMRGSANTPLAYGPKGVKFNPYSYEDAPEIVYWQLRAKEIEDIIGICSYGAGTEDGIPHALMPSDFVELTGYALGIELSAEEFMLIGRRSYNLEKAFNTIHTNFDRKDDLPHRRFFEDPIKSGPRKGETLDKEKFNKMLDEFYELQGWDRETGLQTRKCLEELDMTDVAEKLEKAGKLIE
jgi:aldehyde:ferredoxin oxidoreductase